MVSLRLLQHSGLELRAHQLKRKILTCSRKFASKYNLETEPCANKQSCIKKSPAKLSLILGQDLHHVAPQLVERFCDEHGSMSVYTCSLSQQLITAGNRMYPFTEQTARSALSDTNSFGGATEDTHESGDDDLSSLPTTGLLHSALQTEYPVARRIDQKGASLQFPEDLPEIHANAVISPTTARPSSSATTPSSTSPLPPTAPSPSPAATTWAATRGLELPLGQGLTPPPGTPSPSTASTTGWQGGRVLAQGGYEGYNDNSNSGEGRGSAGQYPTVRSCHG